MPDFQLRSPDTAPAPVITTAISTIWLRLLRNCAYESRHVGGGIFTVMPGCDFEIEPLPAERGRLHAEPRRIDTAGLLRHLAQPFLVEPPKPEIESLGCSRRSFEQCGRHAHDEIGDAERVEGFQQRSFSRRQDDVEHGSDRGGGALQGRARAT